MSIGFNASINKQLLTMLMVLVMIQVSYAETITGFVINNSALELNGDVYYLNASAEYHFTDEVLRAIHNGVPINIVLDVELYQRRRYLWDVGVADLKQRYELQYHALSEQYIILNKNSGEQHTSYTLHSVLYKLRDIKDLPVIDKQLLKKDEIYSARTRVRVSLNNLPVPLRLNAYFSRAWWLISEWFNWQIPVNKVTGSQ